MERPAKAPELKRTCPACNKPVRPGFKFCEYCGIRIPELSTCTHCGTRFIAPVKFCDLCGAKVVLEVQPQSGEPAEEEIIPAEEDTGKYYDTGDEEIQEPDTGELTGKDEEEGEEEEETPAYENGGIAEPDTGELLEKFGREYRDDETLGSTDTPGFSLFGKRNAGSPSPARPGPGSPDRVNDALYFPGTTPEPAGTPVNWIRIIGGIVVIAVIIATVYFIVLPLFSSDEDPGIHSSVTVADITGLPEATAVTTIPYGRPGTGSPSSGPLVPLPTETIPSGQKLFFHVDKDPVTAKITVIFAGSAGVGSIGSAEVKVTHPDGAVASGIILPLKGVSEITLDGSKDTDRLEIIATMTTGESYRVRDELLPLWKE
ncbi:MAG TPA: zinc ribbon domain-containing protein [Methanoregula sp.]|nr:zinc ribbon domain-containing protein [Methanoregula sp.]